MQNLFYVGIDVSKKTLDASLFVEGVGLKEFPHIVVDNNKEGFKEMFRWLRKQGCKDNRTSFLMEYTGFYSNAIREFFDKKRFKYRMENPLELKLRFCIVKEKNDKIDSARIADFLARHSDQLKPSHMPCKELQQLEALNNERKYYVQQRAALACRIQVVSSSEERARHQHHIDLYTKDIGKVEEKMQLIISQNEYIKKNYNYLLTIPGIGPTNAINAIVITENFTAFKTARQYASYIGVAPHSKTSGKCVRWKPKPSNCSDLQAKADLTQGAQSAVEYDPEMRTYFERRTKDHKDTDTIRKVYNHIKFRLILRMFAVVKQQHSYVPLDKVKPISLTKQ